MNGWKILFHISHWKIETISRNTASGSSSVTNLLWKHSGKQVNLKICLHFPSEFHMMKNSSHFLLLYQNVTMIWGYSWQTSHHNYITHTICFMRICVEIQACINPNPEPEKPIWREIWWAIMWWLPRVSIRGPLAHQPHDPAGQVTVCRCPASIFLHI